LVIRAILEEDKAAAMSPTAWMDARLQLLMLDIQIISLNSGGGLELPTTPPETLHHPSLHGRLST
jgi:hypothetical protein